MEFLCFDLSKFYQSFHKFLLIFNLLSIYPLKWKCKEKKWQKKQHLINLNNEFDSNLLIKDIKKYNNVKSYIDEDADNPKVKYYLFVVNEDNKIVRDNKGRAMKQSKFQELVINEFKEQKKFNEFVINEFKEQRKFNESFSKRLDSIENRLTRLESFHETDIKNYDLKKKK